MNRTSLASVFALVCLLGISTTASAGVPEDLTAFKTAASELKAAMESIKDEATAKAQLGKLEAAITKYNQASTALDASLGKLDRTKEADANLYQNSSAEKQTASQSLVDEQLRLLSARALSEVVSTKLNTLRQ
ncbi:hypothetical protein [Archangium primigenium]|uniref:hypothetical protein n=1 Tax=[Archangium] primigenium TaxID=2792470 RepID=UPI00195E4BBD|nr:hypothetical protein [Archangium primigenium]MBM7116416.1 hypothetical protein [Archangium primigenium]